VLGDKAKGFTSGLDAIGRLRLHGCTFLWLEVARRRSPESSGTRQQRTRWPSAASTRQDLRQPWSPAWAGRHRRAGAVSDSPTGQQTGSNRELNGQPLLDCGQETERSGHVPDLPITRRMLGVELVGSRRIWPAHVECLVGPDGSRRIQKIVWMIIGMIKAHPTERRMRSREGEPTRSCQGRAADQWPRDGWAIGKEPAAETLETPADSRHAERRCST